MQRRSSQLTIGYNDLFKQQSDWNVPLDNADINKAFPATSRNWLETDDTTEDIMDCTGEDLLIELLTGQTASLTIDFDLDPDVFAGLAAGAMGSADAPTGGTSEVQTEVMTATGGRRSLSVRTGSNTQTTVQLNYNASASAIQTALENLSNVGAGDIVVANGTRVNPVFTETLTADGGTRTFTVGGQTTAPVAWDANAATIQSALEALSTVESGDIVVAGSGPYTYTGAQQFSGNSNPTLITVDDALLENGGGPGTGSSAIVETTPGDVGGITYTFANGMANQDIGEIIPNTFNLTGGTSTFSTTTPGVGLMHKMPRMTGYSLPLFTFYLGFRGSDKQPVIFKNAVVSDITVRSASREKVTGTAVLIGSAELVNAVGFTMPPCQDIYPLRFGDCKLFIGGLTTMDGGIDYIAEETAREFEWTYSNGVNPQFDGAGIYSTRHERADQRPSLFNYFILGEPGDALDVMAGMRQGFPTKLQLGPDGRNVAIVSESAIIKRATTPVRFGGDPPESEMAIVARPKKIVGDDDTPIYVTANIKQTTTLLTPDS